MGSSGGGGASGRTDFPDYMKNYHQFLLGIDSFGRPFKQPFMITLMDAFNEAAVGDSPYKAYTENQLIPDEMFFPAGKKISDTAYAKPFDLLAALTSFDFAKAVDSKQKNSSNQAWIDSLMKAQSAALDDELKLTVYPHMHSSMRSVGAVMGSAFVFADALIQDSKIKALAKTRLDVEQLALQREELALKEAMSEYQFRQSIVATAADVTKYYHAIRMEVQDKNAEYVAQDLLWDLKLFQYAANPLGSISGSAIATDSGKASMASSAIGGAISGAAAGAMMGSAIPGVGTAVGAVVGGAVGLAGGLLNR